MKRVNFLNFGASTLLVNRSAMQSSPGHQHTATAISLQKRVEASWNAACPGQEILHGVQYLGTVADPSAYGGGMKQKLEAMDAAAHGHAGELSKDHPDGAVAEQLRAFLKAGWIYRLTQADTAAPIVIVKKKSQPGQEPKIRVCIDYGALNKVLVPRAWAMPDVSETIHTVRDVGRR